MDAYTPGTSFATIPGADQISQGPFLLCRPHFTQLPTCGPPSTTPCPDVLRPVSIGPAAAPTGEIRSSTIACTSFPLKYTVNDYSGLHAIPGRHGTTSRPTIPRASAIWPTSTLPTPTLVNATPGPALSSLSEFSSREFPITGSGTAHPARRVHTTFDAARNPPQHASFGIATTAHYRTRRR